MADGGAAEFVLRLKNEVRPGARGAVSDLGAVGKAFRGAASDAKETEKTWQRTFKNRRALVPAPPRIDRGLSVDFQQRRLQRGAAEAMVRRQAQIQNAGGLARLAQIEGTSVSGLSLGTGGAAGLGAVAAIGTAALAAGAAVAYLGGRFVIATTQAVNFGQRSLIALTSIMKSSSEAGTQFDAVRREAGKLGLDVQGAVQSFVQLKNAGFETGQARDLVRMSADLERLTGNSQSAELALRAITQIKMKGRLQAEEITGQLAEHGVSADAVYAELGKTLGKTREEILKLQKTGDLSADVAIPAILQAVRNQLGVDKSGGFAEKVVAGTLGGLAGQLVGAWDNAFISLGLRIKPSVERLSTKLSGLLARVADSPAFTRFADKFTGAFDSAVTFIEKNWTSIENTIVRGVEFMADTVTGAIDFTREHWDEITAAMKGAAIVTGVVVAGFAIVAVGAITLTAPIFVLAGAVAWLTGKMIEGSAEMGKWLRIAGAVAMVLPGMSPVGAALTAGGVAADRGGSIQTLEEQIRSESRARQAGNVAGAASVPGQVGPAGKTIGTLNIPVSVSALDLDDPEVAGQKLAGPVATALRRALEHA